MNQLTKPLAPEKPDMHLSSTSGYVQQNEKKIIALLRIHNRNRREIIGINTLNDIRMAINSKKLEYHLMNMENKFNPLLRKVWLEILDVVKLFLADKTRYINSSSIKELTHSIDMVVKQIIETSDETSNLSALKRDIHTILRSLPEKLRFDLTE